MFDVHYHSPDGGVGMWDEADFSSPVAPDIDWSDGEDDVDTAGDMETAARALGYVSPRAAVSCQLHVFSYLFII